jgi:hypothetical protein
MAVLLLAEPEPPGSARHATILNRPAPEISNRPVPAHYGIYPDPMNGWSSNMPDTFMTQGS